MGLEIRAKPSHPSRPLSGFAVRDAKELWAQRRADRLEHLGGIPQRNTADQMDVVTAHASFDPLTDAHKFEAAYLKLPHYR